MKLSIAASIFSSILATRHEVAADENLRGARKLWGNAVRITAKYLLDTSELTLRSLLLESSSI
jgi:hypothetical protein